METNSRILRYALEITFKYASSVSAFSFSPLVPSKSAMSSATLASESARTAAITASGVSCCDRRSNSSRQESGAQGQTEEDRQRARHTEQAQGRLKVKHVVVNGGETRDGIDRLASAVRFGEAAGSHH